MTSCWRSIRRTWPLTACLAVNGLANTAVAFLLFVLLQVWRNRRGQGLLPLRGIVFSVVLATFTLPSLALNQSRDLGTNQVVVR